MGIAGELRQVLTNLLANSLDAVGQDCRIVLRASTSVNPNSYRQHIRILVSGSGHGMGAITARQIFEPFFTTKG
jgi:two-component system NtrC family sensor kinase